MRTTFEQASSLDAVAILGADIYERQAVFHELSKEYGSVVPYPTFYGWCQTLKLPSGEVVYSASDVLLLLTLVWARFTRKYRSLDRQNVELLQESYACYRVNRNA